MISVFNSIAKLLNFFVRLKRVYNFADDSFKSISKFFLATLLLAILDLLSVVGVPLFVTVLFKPELFTKFSLPYLHNPLFSALNHREMVLYLGVFISLFLAAKGFLSLMVSRYQTHLLAIYQSKLSSALLSTYLNWSYEEHIFRNSNHLIRNAINVPVAIVNGLFIGLSNVFTECFVVLFIGLLLIFVNFTITIIALILMIIIVIFFSFGLKNKLASSGKVVNEEGAKSMQWISQALDGIKEVKLTKSEYYFHDHFLSHFYAFSLASISSQFFIQIPRFFMEFIIMSSLLVISIVMMTGMGDINTALPVLALFGSATLRLIPSITRIVNGLSMVRTNLDSLNIFERDIQNYNPLVRSSKNKFSEPLESIEIKNLSYTYPNSDVKALDNINFNIKRNTIIGLAGKSGSGKSTLVDLIMGFLDPTGGEILINKKPIKSCLSSWRDYLAYVPQQIFILDDTLRRNVGLGFEDSEIDDKKIIHALRKANLLEFVETLPLGLDTPLQENGARLSGGQRQRIAFARALYREPHVLFLDEATSALDKETEDAIIETLGNLRGEMTIIFISHHESTLKICDSVIVLSNGKLELTS